QEEAWSALWAVAQACEVRNRPELAKELYSNLTTNFSKCDVADTAKGCLRRLGMLGKEFGPLKFTALDGKEVDVAKYRGKVVAVYFWATWCRNCLRDAPLIHEAYDRYHRLGFEIIAISLDRDKDTLQKFLAEHEIPWPQYFDGKAWDSEFIKSWGVSLLPEALLVDRKGVLRKMHLEGELLVDALEQLLDA
ncbi:MAG: TlpA family protein disulfide reductase, partial [Planctomycetes bacterium]|nr:TlpA family protein disulfide reductase [Planctomycetota bacterium]